MIACNENEIKRKFSTATFFAQMEIHPNNGGHSPKFLNSQKPAADKGYWLSKNKWCRLAEPIALVYGFILLSFMLHTTFSPV